MISKTTIQKITIWLIPAVVFIVVIGVNFQKPFGFFRESNAALVCINAEAWNQHPAIKQKGIPVNSVFFFYLVSGHVPQYIPWRFRVKNKPGKGHSGTRELQ